MSKYTKTKLIDVADLQIGMYVSQLEVPWSETVYPLQGVLVRSKKDIKELASFGHIISIDESKGLAYEKTGKRQKFLITGQSNKKNVQQQNDNDLIGLNDHLNYRKTNSLANETAHAQEIFSQLFELYEDLKVDLNRLNSTRIKEIQRLSAEMVSSVLINPDALLWVTKVYASNRRVFDHTVRASIWATILGRSMGFSRESLAMLNMAVLLSSVGKFQLRKFVWEDYNNLIMQVNYAVWSTLAVEKLSHCDISFQVLTIISNMTERYDGSGFPNHKMADEIPLLAQLASLAESFDLILQPMFSVKKITFNRALKTLTAIAGNQFDEGLVEEFIQATGLYPVGTHVLLSNGYFGVVVEQSRKRRIRGTIALTHDNRAKRLSNFKIVQLGEGNYQKVIIKKEAEKMLDELGMDDLQQISSLIRQFKNNLFLRVLYFFRRHSWAN